MHPPSVLPDAEELLGRMLLTLGMQSQLPFAMGEMSTGLFRQCFWQLGQSAHNLCTVAHCTEDAGTPDFQQAYKAVAELGPRAIGAAAPQQAIHPELPSRTTPKDTSETWTGRRVCKSV